MPWSRKKNGSEVCAVRHIRSIDYSCNRVLFCLISFVHICLDIILRNAGILVLVELNLRIKVSNCRVRCMINIHDVVVDDGNQSVIPVFRLSNTLYTTIA